MEESIQNNRMARQLIRSDISYAVYLSLLALVHIWHFTALGLNRVFLKQIIYRGHRAGLDNNGFVPGGY